MSFGIHAVGAKRRTAPELRILERSGVTVMRDTSMSGFHLSENVMLVSTCI